MKNVLTLDMVEKAAQALRDGLIVFDGTDYYPRPQMWFSEIERLVAMESYMNEPMILCPVCRQAIPDRIYYAHAKAHQEKK